MKKLIAPLIAVSILLTACGTLDPTGPYKGDKVLYDADIVIVTSYDIIHEFVLFEYTNRETLLVINPAIKEAADKVRKDAPQWFGTALALRDAYSVNPSGGSRDALQTSLRVLRVAALESTRYLATYQTKLNN
jgi:hypothetical protein